MHDLYYIKDLIDSGGKCVDNTYFIFGTKDNVCNNKDYYLSKYLSCNSFTCNMGHKVDSSALPVIDSIISGFEGEI